MKVIENMQKLLMEFAANISQQKKARCHLVVSVWWQVLVAKDNRPGTYDYYMSEPIVEDDAKSVLVHSFLHIQNC